jgi:hypothetical protein
MENLEKFASIELNKEELIRTNGGILINIFLWGVAYGYIKEKLDSGQW